MALQKNRISYSTRVKKGRPALPKIDESLIPAIVQEYHDGASLRVLANKYKCSHEHVRKIVRDRPGFVTSVTGRRLRHEHLEDFLTLIDKGVTPEIAAGMFGVPEKGYKELLDNDPDFCTVIMQRRYKNLADVEQTVATASTTSYKAALERLTRAKETRNHWKSEEEQKSNNQINIIMDWDRGIKSIDNE